jgi:SNF2 family DNA or RNA helicase
MNLMLRGWLRIPLRCVRPTPGCSCGAGSAMCYPICHPRQSYDTTEREGTVWLRSLGQRITVTHVLELITRLKQVCNFCPETGESAKIVDLRERLQALREEGHRSLIFSQYTDENYGVAAIAGRIADYRPEVFTGSLSADEKEACLRRFRNSTHPIPLILSLRAGGHGLNLQEASYVVHFDRWWNPAVEQQAEDRSHRMGQTVPVTVYTYTCTDTIEQRIDEIIRSKGALFAEWVDGVTLDPMARLTEEELFGLFGLTPPSSHKSTSTGESSPQ